MTKLIDYQKKLYPGFFRNRGFEDRLKIVFSWIIKNIKPKSKILDVGCADGYFSREFIKIGYDIYGCDLSTDILGKAKSFGIKTDVCNLEEKLPYKKNYFDIVFAGEVIEHIIDTDLFLTECNRILKKGGFLILTTPNLASLENRLRILFGKQPRLVEYRIGHNTNGHVRAYTPVALINQAREDGFKLFELRGCHLDYDRSLVKRPFHLIHKIIGKIYPKLSRDIIVILKR